MADLAYFREVTERFPNADPSYPREVVRLVEGMLRGDNLLLGSPEAFAEARRIATLELRRERDRYREAIEEYILWTPGRRGHAAAHHRLVAALNPTEGTQE